MHRRPKEATSDHTVGCDRHPDSPARWGRPCQQCARDASRAWNAAHREHCREMNRAYHKKNKEKISMRKREGRRTGKIKDCPSSRHASYRKFREADNITPPHIGVCPICMQTRKLVYDHCHKTKQHRGWLCNTCNRGLGYFGDSAEGLMRAVYYLVQFEVPVEDTLPKALWKFTGELRERESQAAFESSRKASEPVVATQVHEPTEMTQAEFEEPLLNQNGALSKNLDPYKEWCDCTRHTYGAWTWRGFVCTDCGGVKKEAGA